MSRADRWLVDLGIFRGGDERRRCPRLYGERGNGVDQFLLVPEEVVGGLDHDPGKAEVLPGDVVVLVRLQLPSERLFLGQDFADGLIDLVEIRCLHVPLQTRDVRVMRRVQGEALGEVLAQARVGGLGVLDHRGVRIEQDVDGRDGVRLCGIRFRTDQHTG